MLPGPSCLISLRKHGMKKSVSYLDWTHRILRRCVIQTVALEGNINYTGAVISWLKDDMELLMQPEEDWGCMEMKCLRV